jgi:hypothetical protein
MADRRADRGAGRFTTATYKRQNPQMVYYIPTEYLIGRSGCLFPGFDGYAPAAGIPFDSTQLNSDT